MLEFGKLALVLFIYFRFYVQLNYEVDKLQEIIQEVANSSQTLDPEDVRVDLPCLALFSDNEWYRATIKKVVGVRNFFWPNFLKFTIFLKTNLDVFFVDYGNTYRVTLSGVKEIQSKLVSAYPILTIPCSLDNLEQNKTQVRIHLTLETLSIHSTSQPRFYPIS